MLDEALLRPGRLEVHVEIGLPDEQGRLQILKVRAQPALQVPAGKSCQTPCVGCQRTCSWGAAWTCFICSSFFSSPLWEPCMRADPHGPDVRELLPGAGRGPV